MPIHFGDMPSEMKTDQMSWTLAKQKPKYWNKQKPSDLSEPETMTPRTRSGRYVKVSTVDCWFWWYCWFETVDEWTHKRVLCTVLPRTEGYRGASVVLAARHVSPPGDGPLLRHSEATAAQQTVNMTQFHARGGQSSQERYINEILDFTERLYSSCD